MNILLEKVKEVLYAVLPITVIVLALSFTVTPLENAMLFRFILGALCVILGLSIFLSGVDIGISPLGNLMGSALAKSNKLRIITIGGLLLGFFISIAEPDLQILADQVASVTLGLVPKMWLIVIVSLGIAVMMTLGFIRIVYNFSLRKILTILYLIIFILALFISPGFMAISFDASGATTGAMTVPFILALSTGVSALKKDSKDSERDSFGLVAVTSTGAIIAVMLMSIFFGSSGILSGELVQGSSAGTAYSASVWAPFFEKAPQVFREVFMAMLPLLFIFLLMQRISFKLKKRTFTKILKGLVYTLLGLVLFLVGVNAGFMEAGKAIGYGAASMENKSLVVILGFVLGLVTILAEPAVYVLTHQIEEVTSGYVKRKFVLLALSIGVGFAIALSILRILIPQIQLWHYLLPGYLIAVTMSYFVPELFVGIAYDSGGVASGPVTATFILAFTHGVAEAIAGASVLIDGFGMIAMVALTPLIALQTLGLIFKMKSGKGEGKKHGG